MPVTNVTTLSKTSIQKKYNFFSCFDLVNPCVSVFIFQKTNNKIYHSYLNFEPGREQEQER